MATLCVHGPLKALAGGRAEHELPAATVGALLAALQAEYPALRGWVLDERATLRRHINVYVNGERAGTDTIVRQGDRVEVLPAISGG
ncbi:MAG: sulfur-carrier protein [Solirubrobacteraceae bacterium]|nr:sulfur-carrier protein [Solirubrobacteraceae bacterium]